MSKTISDQDVKSLQHAMSKVWELLGGRKTGKRISDQDVVSYTRRTTSIGSGIDIC